MDPMAHAYDELRELWPGTVPPSYELFVEAVDRAERRDPTVTPHAIAVSLAAGRWPANPSTKS